MKTQLRLGMLVCALWSSAVLWGCGKDDCGPPQAAAILFADGCCSGQSHGEQRVPGGQAIEICD